MNQSELLDQFVLEARECLEAIGKGLLEVEREPDDPTLLNDLFRSVHTLKGNCGLFEFKPLERVVHAGEDLLDRVRNQDLAYSAELADALLDAMDFSAQLIDQIEKSGRIEAGADAQAQAHATALRALLDAVPAGTPAPVPAADAPATAAPPPAAPDWLARLDPALLAAHPDATAWRYLPEEGCFFKGEDPWRLACTTPGLLAVAVAGQQPWPEGEALIDWDCYQCRLDIVLLSSAPRAYVEEHFRCVIEQLQGWQTPPTPPAAPAAPTAGERTARARARQLWADQLALLARGAVAAGTVQAARRTLRRLLVWLDDGAAVASLQALADDADAPTLLAWARRQTPPAEAAAAEPQAAHAVPEAATEPAAADPGRRGGDEANGAAAHKVLKVGQEKVDRLMDLIGEMVVAKNSLPYLAQRAETVFGQRELAREIKAQYTVINRIAEDMQHAIMQVRMLPVGAVFQRFGRLVRDISRKLGKEVQLVVEGEETEADKNVIESLADPLIHILRNSLDHGIEMPQARRAAGKPAAGTIRIRAHQESDRVVIEIGDDGAGVDAARVRAKAVERGLIPADRAATLSDQDAVQLIFLPGFSTAEQISDLSGRGVGMDVVRTAIERINGSVELSSVQGRGTTLRLSLPLSMAITNVMVIESAGRRFGVPMDLIVETVRVHGDDIHCFKQARTTVLRGRIVPLRALNDLLALETEPQKNADGELAVLVVRVGNESVGLIVDQFHGASDIILKPLEGVLAGLTGFAGTALMGDGGVLMVLNPKELLTWASAT
ncbi:two-component system chemotaxis sensor kinase CheA [Rubrivivax gelatinosus]|uniref:chemotaxis protein CheA n=3 Tax=Rubrivivax gelatinosus TaxID=28068 RepID=UPI0018CB057E|nr:chemotaxis protein CheA [Rubrivivax gelatinosus]MBG6082867.1 two-component system chemotaxis sensor kinase CheA [Rubrivivax gelatinosus]